MKKILLLFAVSLFAFGCKQEYSEAQMRFLGPKKIPEEKGNAMKIRFKDPGRAPKIPQKYNFHWDTYDALVEHSNKVFIMPVIFSKEDEVEYRRAWGMSDTASAGAVEGFSSFVIQVGTNSDYYHFAQICPPPEDCTQSQQ